MGSSASKTSNKGSEDSMRKTQPTDSTKNNNNKTPAAGSDSRNNGPTSNDKKNNQANNNNNNNNDDKKKKNNSKSGHNDFPTPVSLMAAQQSYTNNKKNAKNSKAGKSGVPEPFPPPTSKEQVFDVHSTRALDRNARKAPLSIAADSYSALAKYLVAPATNEVGKVRSFYVWIASQRLQTVVDYVGNNGNKIPPEDTPLYTVLLTLVKQWGNGYSELMSKLCQEVKIPCRVVKGKVKGSGYRLGEPVKAMNDYCIVYVDGSWRIVDPHWGSQYVISNVDRNDDWEALDGPGGGMSGAESNDEAAQHELGQHCDEFYFLTDPVAFVYTHLTLDPACQLLARPVTEDEFTEMAYLKDTFFELGMTTVSHPKCLVEADDNGTIVFEFGLDKTKPCTFSYELLKSTNDPALNVVEGGISLDQFVTLENLTEKLRVTIMFPRIGRYKFELSGKELEGDEGFREICEYSIYCRKPNFRHQPNPENNRGEWGAGADTARYGLQPVGQEGGVIHAKDGKAYLRFRSDGSHLLLFKPNLKSMDGMDEDLADNICHYQTGNSNNGQDVDFHMKLPRQGKYTLEIYAKDISPQQQKKRGAKTERPGVGGKKDAKVRKSALDRGFMTDRGDYAAKSDAPFENICNYIVQADCGYFDLAPFPPLDNKYGQTGDLTPWINGPNNSRLQSFSPKQSIFDPHEAGNLAVTLVSDREVEYVAKMIRFRHLQSNQEEDQADVDGDDEDYTKYVYLARKGTAVTVRMLFPKVGFYKVNLMAAGDKGQGHGPTIIYQCLVNAVKPDTQCTPYPTFGSGWHDTNELVEPMTGHLEANKKVPLKVRVPEAKSVRAEWNDGKDGKDLATTKKDPTLWEGEITTDPKGEHDVTIIADNKKDQPLLTYQVLKGEELKELKSSRETANKEAKEYQKEMEEREAQEREEAERQKKEEEDKAKEAEADFDKNRKKYEQEEEKLRQKEEEEEKAAATAEPEEQNLDESNRKIQPLELEAIKEEKVRRKKKKKEKKHDKVDEKKERQRDERKEEAVSFDDKKHAADNDADGEAEAEADADADNVAVEATPRTHRNFDNKEDWRKYQEKQAHVDSHRSSGSRSPDHHKNVDAPWGKIWQLMTVYLRTDELTQQMALEKLRESMRFRKATMLKDAIDDCKSFEKLQTNREVKNASKTLQVINSRKDLEAACEAKDAAAIRQEVENIQKAGLTKYLQPEIHEAIYQAELLERLPNNRAILDMGKKMMTEIRRYQHPNPVMHRVMQGALLMLGEDEDTTDSWKQCQKLCNPQGHTGLNRKMFELQPSKIHPELVSRSKEIFKDLDISKVQAVGPGAVTFYVWARNAIEDAETSQKNGEKVEPASRERQREILGRPPLNDKKPSARQQNPPAAAAQPKPNKQAKRRNDDYNENNDGF